VENREIKKYLLVEGESDERFFSTYIKYLELNNSSVNAVSLAFRKIGGSDDKKLTLAISELKADLRNKPIDKIGIILDIDESSKEEKTKQVNNVLKDIFENDLIFNDNVFSIKINDKRTVTISYHFIEDIAGIKNLELLLQQITTCDPVAANCLSDWISCARDKGAKVRDSDYLKLWRDIYVRYDYCKERALNKHASENCSFEKSLDNMLISGKPKAWDFKAVILTPLFNFLTDFVN
jgi:hypothetical protein